MRRTDGRLSLSPLAGRNMLFKPETDRFTTDKRASFIHNMAPRGQRRRIHNFIVKTDG